MLESGRKDPLVDLVPGVVYTLDVLPGGGRRFREVSSQLEDLLGFLPAEWIASPRCWEQQIHPDDREWVLESVSKAEETGDLRAFDYRMDAVPRVGEHTEAILRELGRGDDAIARLREAKAI